MVLRLASKCYLCRITDSDLNLAILHMYGHNSLLVTLHERSQIIRLREQPVDIL